MFEHITIIEELRTAYRVAAMEAHPDRGGSDEAMKAVNAVYEKRFNELKCAHNADETKSPINEAAEAYTAIVTELLKLEGIEIELCGSWIWVSGETRPHKDTLKVLGLRWAKGKAKWYYTQEAHKAKRGSLSMDEIRKKYGSIAIEKVSSRALLAR